MAYSRKGRLMFRGALFAVVAAWAAFVLLFHPSRSVVPYVAIGVMIVCFVLFIRAFLYLDEIERARRIRVSFYGAVLGIWLTTFVLLFIMLQPSLLDRLADILVHHRPHLPLEYYTLGVLTPLLAQCVCALLVSAVMRLKPGI